jgi:hypothetical protein
MDCVVSPVDQVLFIGEDEVNTTEPPAQKVVGPPAVIAGVAGSGFTVTASLALAELHPAVDTNTE